MSGFSLTFISVCLGPVMCSMLSAVLCPAPFCVPLFPFYFSFSFSLSFFLFFWAHHSARGILVPQPGIEPAPPAVEARSLNHWTAREVPSSSHSCPLLGLKDKGRARHRCPLVPGDWSWFSIPHPCLFLFFFPLPAPLFLSRSSTSVSPSSLHHLHLGPASDTQAWPRPALHPSAGREHLGACVNN